MKNKTWSQEIAGYVTVGKAAHLLNISERQVRVMIFAGSLIAVAIGDRQPIWLIDRDSLTAIMDVPRKKRGPQKGYGGRPKKPLTQL
jgi:hypothetical protein